jgi:molybdopterin-synthase adenylyltransferase
VTPGFSVDRHDRHRMIDWFDQDRLAGLHVAIVGAGAIGNEVCKSLVLLGVGRLTVFDRDVIELHNLTRSVLFREGDLGLGKADVVARRAAELDPGVRVEAVRLDVVERLRPSQVAGFDVLFCCVDNFEARLRLNELCLVAGVDLVNGAIDSRHASVEHFPFSAGRRAGCYECGLPPSAYGRIAQRYACGWLRRAGLAERRVPTTIVTSSLAAALMVSWGLRMGAAPVPGARRALVDSIGGGSQVAAVARSDACPCCGPLADDVVVMPWRAGESLTVGAAADALALRLPEAVVLSARCESCGLDARERVPPGSRTRSHTTDVRRCPRCGDEAVAIDDRDALTLGELRAALGDRAPQLPYFWVDDPRTSICVEIADD